MEDNKLMGTVTVSDRAVMQIASDAAKSCSGVMGMSEKTRAGGAVRAVGGKSTAGVYIRKTKSGVSLEVYIACGYGADTKMLSETVREKVKSSFDWTGITIKEVSVHINDVR